MLTLGKICFWLVATVGALALMTLSVAHIVRPSRQAEAWTTQNFSWVFAPNSLDRFMNYDGGNPGYSTNVDWPVRYLWKGNAEIDKVKDRIDGCGGDPTLFDQRCSSGGPISLHMVVTGPGDFYDSDNGKKAGNSCSWDQHMRLYADPGQDRNYNQTWGFYIVSTSHRDYEWLGTSWFCSNTYTSTEGNTTYPDESEYYWNTRIIYINTFVSDDYGILTNSQYLANPETYRWADGSHLVESNGYGSIITVP